MFIELYIIFIFIIVIIRYDLVRRKRVNFCNWARVSIS